MVNENVSFIDHTSRIWLPDGCKLTIIWKKDNDVKTCWHDVIVKVFWHWRVSLVKFSYWPKFHVNITTGSGIMTVFGYKGLTRNPEIENSPGWILPNIWRLGQIRNTKFGTNVSNKMLWMMQNVRVTAFTFLGY